MDAGKPIPNMASVVSDLYVSSLSGNRAFQRRGPIVRMMRCGDLIALRIGLNSLTNLCSPLLLGGVQEGLPLSQVS
jgi:hypothetical protein